MKAKIQRYKDALKDLTSPSGYVPIVSLILAVPIERKDKPLLKRTITSDYRTKARPNHNGIDFNGGPHAKGYAQYLNYLADGAEVSRSEVLGSYGNVVQLTAYIDCILKGKEHKKAKISFRYAHLHSRSVKKGDKLKLWDSFGTLGTTGNSTGPHKHFEVWVNGVRVNPHDVKFKNPLGGVGMKGEIYVVKKGDVAWKLAKDFEITLQQMAEWNPHIEDLGKIYPGDEIRVSPPDVDEPNTDEERLKALEAKAIANEKASKANEKRIESIDSKLSKIKNAL